MKHKKRRLFLLVLLGALLLCAALFLIANRGNITALWHGLFHSEEELAQRLEENNSSLRDIISAEPDISIRDITDEEREALRDGSLTPEELTDLLLGRETTTPADSETSPEQEPESESEPPVTAAPSPETEQASAAVTTPSTSAPKLPESTTAASTPTVTTSAVTTAETKAASTTAASEAPNPSPSTVASDYEEQLNAIIARTIVLREEFLLMLDELEKEAIWEYECMTAEQRGDINYLLPIARSYLSRVSEMEESCDAKMDAISAELTLLLRRNGKDLSLVRSVQSAYAKEKSLTKAVYIAKLKERGLY